MAILPCYLNMKGSAMNAVSELSIDQLADNLIKAKADEAVANAKRVAIEQQIVDIIGAKEEGAKTVPLANGMKLTLTGKLTYSADISMLLDLCEKLPHQMRPIKTEPKLDETGAKYLRNNEPKIWAHIAPAITVKPAKTSITIKA